MAVGVVLVLISAPLLLGGWAASRLPISMDLGEGYAGFEGVAVETETQALVLKGLDASELGPLPGFLEELNLADLATLRVTAENQRGRRVFMGLAWVGEAEEAFAGVAYDQLAEVELLDGQPHVEYRRHPGGELAGGPLGLDIWDQATSGSGPQTLTWDLTRGERWLVLMNEDGSPGVEATLEIGVAALPLLSIGSRLTTWGVVLLGLGIALIVSQRGRGTSHVL